MSGQLAFDLPFRAALGRADFFVSASNAQALAALDGWRDWPGGKHLLIGPAGSGKTHLTQVWTDMAGGARIIKATALGGAALPSLGQSGAVAVEDCDSLAQNAGAQEALFHLHNMLAANGAALLLTARHPPRDWGLTLPDLESRVQATSIARIESPDDALLSAVLIKLFSDRQITVTPTLIAYLLPRMERSFDAARALVAAIDAASLAQGSPVNRALAASLLDKG
ncbi:DnaA/Hda family protein [Pseudorhodobacter sp.]|uniref:DnaA ATPase domain-containing protein n=1 Tax=Pseudorhodobacter sp. TaxID=1934400 RepID=UPI0026499249|nr:DnaA/Hda family protein [Pseudorhodobacter sp.]MDN5789142.1 DnaA/Hda family protein [Pseudorhodobacter sp.]